MMLAPDNGLSSKELFDDSRLVWEGRVAPLLLWDKHPRAVALAGFLALIVLIWLARLFRPKRISRPQAERPSG
jgi:hypothetical protein